MIGHYIKRCPLTALGFILLFFLSFFAALASVIAPHSPSEISPSKRLLPPARTHILGTDHLGRDIATRVLYGGRVSMLSGMLITLIALFGGGVLGVIAGYFRVFELFLMRVVDVLMAIPPLLFGLTLMAAFGPGLKNVIIAVGLAYLPRVARVIYASTLQIKAQQYIEAAHALGAGHCRVLMCHIVPNLLGPVVVQSSFIFAAAMIESSALDFLGVGVPPYIPSWGGMLNEAKLYILTAPWLLVGPGAAIAIAVMGANLLGDGLRDLLDPRLRKLL